MSSPDQSKGGRSRDEVLAGEYVLGVLSLEDRQKVERRMRSDRQFAAIVSRWEQNLSAFNDEYESMMPSAVVFPKIGKRIFGERSGGAGLWNSLPVWRSVALASVLLAAGVLVVNSDILSLPTGGGRPLVAALAAQNSAVNLFARYDSARGRLMVTPVAASEPEAKSLEVWLIRGNNAPQPLGVLPQTGEGEIAVPADMRSQFEAGAVLAVSLEPYGGSPTGKPTGPVIASGATRFF